MEVSSTPPTSIQESPKEKESPSVMKKALDVQEKQVSQIIESAAEQSKQITAQKTGIGNNINLMA